MPISLKSVLTSQALGIRSSQIASLLRIAIAATYELKDTTVVSFEQSKYLKKGL